MRVVAGKYGGRQLVDFNLKTTKPTLDKIREAMFDILQYKIQDASVLDLFAGTGAVGLEALSRGAKQVDFVDSNIKAIQIIKQNLKGVEDTYNIYKTNALNFLKTANKYDIIIIDPPYATNLGLEAIEYIIANDLLNEDGIIIFETLLKKEIKLSFIPADNEVLKSTKKSVVKKGIDFSYLQNNYQLNKYIYGTEVLYTISKI